MIYIINEEIANKKGLTLPALLAILLVKTGASISDLFQELENKQILIKDILSNGDYLVTQRWDQVITDILVSADKTIPQDERLDKLISSLMDLYPQGKKAGTSLYWRGNKKDCKERLQKFFKLYGSKYTDDQIINATKSYISSFNGRYDYMRTLKYFIWKDDIKKNADGIGYVDSVSDLATYLENANSVETLSSDWTNTLR